MMKQFLIGTAIIAAVSGCSKSGDPKAVVQDFMGRMTSGNCNGIRDLVLASQGDQIEAGCGLIAKAGTPPPQATITYGDATVNGDDATVAMSDAGASRNVKLKKENGAWKVDIMSMAM